jgi:hypothetical protein
MTKLILAFRNIAKAPQNWLVEMCVCACVRACAGVRADVCMCVCILYICVIVVITDRRLNYLRAFGFKKSPDEELVFALIQL